MGCAAPSQAMRQMLNFVVIEPILKRQKAQIPQSNVIFVRCVPGMTIYATPIVEDFRRLFLLNQRNSPMSVFTFVFRSY